MAASPLRGTSSPSAAMHLSPLNSRGLWDAVGMISICAPRRGTRYWTAGVGRMPSSATLWPASASVEDTMRAIIGLEVRASQPIVTRSFGARTVVMPDATWAMNEAVSLSPTTSRIPLVPNSRMTLDSGASGGLRYMMGKVSSQNPSPRDSLPARWWADEMLGRLARYLRMVGLDTAYVPGLTDDEVVRRAGAEGRTLLTRDRQLARRVPGAFLV